MNKVGIRQEEKAFETRAPLIPSHVRQLREQYGIHFVVEPSQQRAFGAEQYETAGAEIGELKGSDVGVILGIKEMPVDFFEGGKVYAFFSHTVKGQEHNMAMLKRILEVGATLLDYERIVDETGRRLVYFGNWAGFAGMSDTLRVLGQRLDYEGLEPNPFRNIKPTLECGNLEELRTEMKKLGERISQEGIPDELSPFIVGFAGYGNVSRGAQEIFDILPHKEIDPSELGQAEPSPTTLYKCVFKEEHMVEPIERGHIFDLQEYYRYGTLRYRGVFERYIPYLTVLMNCIYWSDKYPRLLTKEYIRDHWQSPNRRLRVIGDISCDIEGAIEMTVMATKPDNPAFTYIVSEDRVQLGVAGDGPVIIAVDNLPCELPRESSASFSQSLKPFIPHLAETDFSVTFESLDLPRALKNAIVVFRGELTEAYRYLDKYVSRK